MAEPKSSNPAPSGAESAQNPGASSGFKRVSPPVAVQRGGGIGVLDYDGQISQPGAAEAKLCDLNRQIAAAVDTCKSNTDPT